MDVDEVTSRSSVRRRSRRTWRLAGALVLLLIVAGGVAVAALTGKGSSAPSTPAQQFDAAYQAFHTQFDTHSTALTTHLLQAGDAVEDPGFMVAVADAKALANDYRGYATAVKAIAMPASAAVGQARIVQVASAGDFLMSQAADFFSKAGMQAALDADWPQVKTQLALAEATTRSALGLST